MTQLHKTCNLGAPRLKRFLAAASVSQEEHVNPESKSLIFLLFSQYFCFHSTGARLFKSNMSRILHHKSPCEVLHSVPHVSRMPTIQTPPHAQILNPPKSRQEMPSSVEQNAFDRPPLALSPSLCSLSLLPPSSAE